MIIHNFDPVALDFGLFEIRWYSLSYIVGIILAWIYSKYLITKISKNNYNFISIKSSQFDDLIIYLVLGIVIGGRIGYVLFYNFDYYTNNFPEIFKLWYGGMSFHGGLIGVVIATLIFSKISKINFFKFSDIIACAAPIGIFLGRIANFINGELYGKISNLPWAIIFPMGGHLPRHPSQIYEAIFEGLILFIILNFLISRDGKKDGYISSLFLIFYSIFRFFIEFTREPDAHIGLLIFNLSMGQLISIIFLISGIILWRSKKNV